MRINPKILITFLGEAREDVEYFTDLGSSIIRDGQADKDIELTAQQTFKILQPIWLSNKLSKYTKLCIFNANKRTVLIDGSGKINKALIRYRC